MKTLTTNHVLDALTEVTRTLDARPVSTRTETRAQVAAPDVDELDAAELLVLTLAEAIDSIATDPDLPTEPLEDPLAAQETDLDAEQVPAARS